jgi:hypothetical protein
MPRISELDPAASVSPTAQVPIVQGGNTVRVDAQLINADAIDDLRQDVADFIAGGQGLSWESVSYPVYAAHRGMEMCFPENTMIAFEETIKAGGNCIELDVYLATNGELYVMHDQTTNRTCRDLAGGAIALDMELLEPSDLYGLDASYLVPTNQGFFGSDFKFNKPPLLRDVLATFRGRALFIIDAKPGTLRTSRQCGQAICDLAEAMQIQPAVLVYHSATGAIEAGLDPKGCKIANRGTGSETQETLNAYKATGYFAVLTPKASVSSTHMTRAGIAGLKVIGSTYIYASEVDPTPDILFCVDIYTIQGKRLAAGRDYLLREYPGPGYVKGGFDSGDVGTQPIYYPVIRTIGNSRAIGYTAAHPTAAGRSRFGIANIDPDPNNDNQYTLDFDVAWTEIKSGDEAEGCLLAFELDKPNILMQGQSTSPIKECYYFMLRANGGCVLAKVSGSTPTASTLDSETTGLPNPPTINTLYPCRIVVNNSGITCTFDPGGSNETILTSSDTAYRGRKFLMVERRGHGFMIANLRAS